MLDIKTEFNKQIEQCKNLEELENIRVVFLGRKGKLSLVMKGLKDLPDEEKKKLGQEANQLKQEIESEIYKKTQELEAAEMSGKIKEEWIDITQPVLPDKKRELGNLHPLTQVQNEIEDIFKSMGFMVLDGPELESEYFNFEALNIPSWHPAREMQDTFYIKDTRYKDSKIQKIPNSKSQNSENRLLMRTHTSPVQVRAMLKYGAPIRSIVPGRVFRNEATDACHEHTFDQLEGLMVDKDISIANLIATMKTLLSGVFKKDVKVRMRPGFFPFVEPGFELDVNCLICGGKGCATCKHSGWLELMPCGMIHSNVLRYGGVDPNEYSGFAFGLGMTRLVLMKYGINDIRLLKSGDLRFLRQF